jgi:hypothetical protein
LLCIRVMLVGRVLDCLRVTVKIYVI